MFRDKFQQERLSIFYACGATPLELWGMKVKNGNTRRVVDEEVNSLAFEITGTNVSTTYIFSPKNPRGALGICLPFLILVIKNMKRYFTFEITILDDQNMHRRFRASNFQRVTRVRPFGITMPICLTPGWNQVQFNLAEFTRRAYNTNYVETTRMQIHANCRIRRVYFSDRLYEDKELPDEYRLFFPCDREKSRVGSKAGSKSSVTGVPRFSRVYNAYDYEEYNEAYGDESLGPSIPSRTLVTPVDPKRLRIHVPSGEYEEDTDEASQRESEADPQSETKFDVSQGSPRQRPSEAEDDEEPAVPGDDHDEVEGIKEKAILPENEAEEFEGQVANEAEELKGQVADEDEELEVEVAEEVGDNEQDGPNDDDEQQTDGVEIEG